MIELDRTTAQCSVMEGVTPPSEYPPIKVVCLDANEDGVINSLDHDLFMQSYPSVIGDLNYVRRFDFNRNGSISDSDKYFMEDSMGLNLEQIRAAIKTGEYEHLVWPDYGEAYIAAVGYPAIKQFIGNSSPGWTTLCYRRANGYSCGQFATEMMVASYKGLGYGCLLFGVGEGHAYNIFWIGGDWHDLNNWYGLEPQNGKLFSAANPNLPNMYTTKYIYLPLFKKSADSVRCCGLTIENDTVIAAGRCMGGVTYGTVEEPVPSTFDITLGIGGI